MREIKFRAWDGSKIQTEFCIDSSDGMIFTEHDNGGDIAGCCGEYKEWAEYHDYWKLMQFTGLKDKNGVEIYEGDIVEKSYPESRPQRRSFVFTVEYKELFDNEMGFSLGIGFDLHGEDSHELEVIGNIYENPELLKKVP